MMFRHRSRRLAVALVLGLLATASSLYAEIPGLSSKVLDNGLEVIVIQNSAVPLVTVEIAVHAGGFVEPPELDGLSHLYEHMFFKGNAEIPTQEGFLEKMQELGAVWNGTTSEELVNYYFTLPSNRLWEGTEFLRDALLKPLFRRDELTRERPVVLGEFDRNEANPNFHLFREVSRVLWGETFSRKNVIGDRTVLATATREQMLLFRENYYVPNNSALLFSGDVDPVEAFELAEEFFGDWPRAEDPFDKFPVPPHAPLAESSTLAVIQPVERVTLNVSWHGPGMKEDPPATYAADVLSFILSQPNSRWNRRLVESGLFDFTNLFYLSQVHTGPISLLAATSADRFEAARDAFWSEIAALASPDYFSDEELEYAKKQLEFSELRNRQRPSSFTHTVAFWWATGGLEYYENYIDDLRAVTREDIRRYVEQYLENKPSVTGVLLSEEDLATIESLASADVVRPQSGTSGTAIAAQRGDDAVTEEFEVAGVPVILRQLSSSPTVAVAAFVRGGLNDTTASDAGLENLIWSVAAKQSQKYDKESMATELTRLGAALSHQIQSSASVFTLDAIADNVGPSLDLFFDALVHPRFSDEELDLARERQLSALATNAADPDLYLRRLSARAHLGDHPSGLDPLGERATVESFGVDDLDRRHDELITRSRLLFVVTGGIDRSALQAALEPVLSRLPEGAPPSPPRAVSGLEETSPVLEARDLPTVYIQGAFPAVDSASPDFAAHLLAHRILSRELFEEIRTKRNLAYAAAAAVSRKVPNSGFVYVTTAEPNEALPVIRDTVLRLREQPLSADEVRHTAESLRTGLLMGTQDPAGLALALGTYELNSGGWERLDQVLMELTEITPAEVQRALQSSVRNVDFAVLGDLSKVDPELLDSL